MYRAFLLCFISLLILAVNRSASQDQQRRPAQINIHNADIVMAPYNGLPSDVMRFIGNVRLSHDEVYMVCDSAHRYSGTNLVHAFGNVHINQGDTLNLYGDRLTYYGNRRYAEMRGNVRLSDRETTLTTEYLDFDINDDFGYYPNYGVVINGDNRLESVRGYYYSEEKLFYFRDSVVITNPDYTIRSDTLKYNTVTEVAYFLGPTTIIGEETEIYCENGWYDTRTDISQFNENARVRNNNQFLMADSIYYDNGNGTGRAFINVEVIDTVENIIIKGDYAWFNRDPEETFVTDRALFIQISDNDTLYLHADTLRSWLQVTRRDNEIPSRPDTLYNNDYHEKDTIMPSGDRPVDDMMMMDGTWTSEPGDTVMINDSVTVPNDTTGINGSGSTELNDTVRILVAYYGVRFFSNDMQGKCDSLFYNMRDSIIYMYREPVIWSDESQLTAEQMVIRTRDGKADQIMMNNSSFIVSEETPGMYNQIKGKDILGFFRDGVLYRVNVMGNAETLYYPVDDEEIIGINKAASANLVIFMKDNKPERIRFLTRPEATLHPLEEVPAGERILNNFQWLDQVRPKFRDDVFRK